MSYGSYSYGQRGYGDSVAGTGDGAVAPAAPAVGSYSFEVTQDNPVLWLKFDNDLAGRVADSSTYPKRVSLVDGQQGLSPSFPATGPKAMGFDGLDDYLQVNDFGLGYPLGWTISAWIDLQTIPLAAEEPCIFSSEFAGNSRMPLVLGFTSSLLFVGYYNAAWYRVTYKLPLGRRHIVGTWSGTVLRLYVNGALVASATPTANTYALQSNPIARVMRRWDLAQYIDGDLDALEVYPQELTQARVTALYDAGNRLLYDNFADAVTFSLLRSATATGATVNTSTFTSEAGEPGTVVTRSAWQGYKPNRIGDWYLKLTTGYQARATLYSGTSLAALTLLTTVDTVGGVVNLYRRMVSGTQYFLQVSYQAAAVDDLLTVTSTFVPDGASAEFAPTSSPVTGVAHIYKGRISRTADEGVLVS